MIIEVTDEFCQRIRAVLKRKGIKISHIRNPRNLWSKMSMITHGHQKTITVYTLFEIAQTLGCDPQELVDDELYGLDLEDDITEEQIEQLEEGTERINDFTELVRNIRR